MIRGGKRQSSTSSTSTKKNPKKNDKGVACFIPVLPLKKMTIAVCDLKFSNSKLGQPIFDAFDKSEMKLESKSLPVPYSILWCAGVGPQNCELLEHMSERKFRETAAVVFTWQQYIYKIGTDSLLTYIENVKTAYANKNIIVIVYNLKKYFNYFETTTRTSTTVTETSATDSSTANSNYHLVAEQKPEAVKELEIKIKLDTGVHIVHIVDKALLESFFLAINKNMLKFDKSKNGELYENLLSTDQSENWDIPNHRVREYRMGLLNIWRGQLEALPRVTELSAYRIVNRYKSPNKLWKSYDECQNPEKMLQDIPGVDSEMSKTVYLFYNSLDKNQFL